MVKRYANYTDDWLEIRDSIRFDRAGGKCERCGAPHRSLIAREKDNPEDWQLLDDFEAIKDTAYSWHWSILTVAHLDHNPQNNDPENLLALCRHCHILNDANQHGESLSQTNKRRRLLKRRLK